MIEVKMIEERRENGIRTDMGRAGAPTPSSGTVWLYLVSYHLDHNHLDSSFSGGLE